jgi:3-deoxy-D-manno-octulosonate 8-phosphate phosphatase (KDO 8-P phosphatase)
MSPTAAREAAIQLLVLDVDGVLTDGSILLGASGEEMKRFHVRDGVGVKALLAAGIGVAVISGRRSTAVTRRMAELGVEQVFQGVSDKLPVFEDLRTRCGVAAPAVAVVGDDLPDLAVMRAAGLGIAVADAHADVIAAAHWVTVARGGQGAVREVADRLLAARAQAPGVAR